MVLTKNQEYVISSILSFRRYNPELNDSELKNIVVLNGVKEEEFDWGYNFIKQLI